MTSTRYISNWRGKWLLLAGLYVSQTLGLAFVTTTVPVILRQSGAGLDKISLIFVLGLFWSLKFLWAPFIDRYGSNRFGHYRCWIILFQVLMICTTIGASWFSIHSQLNLLFGLFMCMTFFAATQDIAVDGLAVTMLKPEERGTGSSIQTAGNMLGFMAGGGLVLLAYEWINWKGSLLVLAAGMALPLFSILNFKEQPFPEDKTKKKTNYKVLISFFTRHRIWYWVFILLLFRVNNQITYWLLNPYLVDSGWNLGRIGIAINIFGPVAGVLGAALGGTLVLRIGRKMTMLTSLFIGILGTGGMLGLVYGFTSINPFGVYGVIGLIMMTYGASSTVIYTVIMDKSDPASAATDFSLQWSLSGISAMIFGGLAMASAENIGYSAVLAISIGIAGVSMILVWFYTDFDTNLFFDR